MRSARPVVGVLVAMVLSACSEAPAGTPALQADAAADAASADGLGAADSDGAAQDAVVADVAATAETADAGAVNADADSAADGDAVTAVDAEIGVDSAVDADAAVADSDAGDSGGSDAGGEPDGLGDAADVELDAVADADQGDAVGSPDALEGCPEDPDKAAPGVCGCGVPDSDADGDGVADCVDGDLGLCSGDAECSDGLQCTATACVSGLCSTTAKGMCGWPAEGPYVADNLTPIEPEFGQFTNDFHVNLSGAVWNPVSRMLWVARNNNPAKVWAVEQKADGTYGIHYKGGARGEWGDKSEFGDLEALTFVDFADTELLYLLNESAERVEAWDFSGYGDKAAAVAEWDLSASLPGGSGAEGLTFVPDAFLAAQGFTDGDGNPVQSVLGMGGLMFVGHQNGGFVYVFDLDPAGTGFDPLGVFTTSAKETAGLEFDRSTGLLFIWHGGHDLNLEVTRLSSKAVAAGRRLETVKVYDGPGETIGSDNLEGFAVVSNGDCVDGKRSAFLTNDGGNLWSLLRYRDFPCE